MIQARILIVSLLFLSVKSFSQVNQHINNVSFRDLLRDNLISDNPDAGENTNSGDRTNHGWRYWCDSCSCGFNKLKSYKEHLSGKRHHAVMAQSESLWEAYLQSGSAFYDPTVTQKDAVRAWSLDLFMDGLQARSRSSIKNVLVSGTPGGQLDPSLRLADLSPQKRAALWRLLYTCTVPSLAPMVAELPPHYVRVKEVLESLETFRHVERLMRRSTIKGQKFSHVYDVGCGHGLVGMLCAVSFPQINVHAIDLVSRESFQAQRKAFQSTGIALDNLTFELGDLSILPDQDYGIFLQNNTNHSLLLCVHGCKSLTHESIELAERNNWAWLSLPCCLQSENHLETSFKKVADETRFAMLCGAIATKYQAETVTTIDSRITARGIVLASLGNDYQGKWPLQMKTLS